MTLCLKGSFYTSEASSKIIAFPCPARVSRLRPSPKCPPILIHFHGRTGTKTGTRKPSRRASGAKPQGLETRMNAFNDAKTGGTKRLTTCEPQGPSGHFFAPRFTRHRKYICSDRMASSVSLLAIASSTNSATTFDNPSAPAAATSSEGTNPA